MGLLQNLEARYPLFSLQDKATFGPLGLGWRDDDDGIDVCKMQSPSL